MRNKHINIILSLLIAFSMVGCYPEEKIESQLGTPKHTIEYKDNAVDKYIYDVHCATGIFILYEFSDLDYKWNLGSASLSEYNLNRQSDRAVLSEGINYLDKVLMNYYEDDFKKHYFPLYIFLCDSLRVGAQKNDLPAMVGRHYIAIGQIGKNLKNKTNDELLQNKGIINGEMWGNFIYANNIIPLPDEFFAACEDYYGFKIGSNTDNPPFDAKKMGFWEKDDKTSTSYAYLAPKKQGDVYQFVKMITSNSYEEIMAKMAGYPILYNKYLILTNYLKLKYNIDLQAIGNNKPTASH